MTNLLLPKGAEQHLSAVDDRLGALVEQFGPCPLGTSGRDPFDALLVAILGQQLSLKAAASIRERLQVIVGAERPFAPAHFLPHTADSLRVAGLSAAKAGWILNLARLAGGGKLDLVELAGLARGGGDAVRSPPPPAGYPQLPMAPQAVQKSQPSLRMTA